MDVPGTGMGGADPLMAKMLGYAEQPMKDATKMESDLAASRGREAEIAAKRQAAIGPKQAELKTKLEQTPQAPNMGAMPQAPTAPKLDTKEMGETLSLITALAALGGALTRQPLTAALNNFSAGVHGLVQGNQMVFQNSIKEFETNLQKAKNDNETEWRKYQAARDKYKTDIAGLQNAIKLIASEYDDQVTLEMAKRGDLVSVYKAKEKANADMARATGSVAKMFESQKVHAENVRRHNELHQEHLDREKRLSAVHADPKAQDKLTKEYQGLARKAHAAYVKAYDKAKTDDERKEADRRYKDGMATLDAEMKSRGFAGKLTMGGETAAPAPAAPAAAPASAPAQQAVKTFASPEEADAAAQRGELKPGMRISIGGQTGTWQ